MANASPTPRQAEQLKALSSRAGALALALLMLLSACATRGQSLAGGYRNQPQAAASAPEKRVSTPTAPPSQLVVVEADVVEPGAVSTRVVVVTRAEFQRVVQKLGGQLRVQGTPQETAQRLFQSMPEEDLLAEVSRGRVLGLVPLDNKGPLVPEAEAALRAKYLGWCEARGGGDCLGLFDDGPYLRADDRRTLALALAFGTVLDETREALGRELSPRVVLSSLVWAVGMYHRSAAHLRGLARGRWVHARLKQEFGHLTWNPKGVDVIDPRPGGLRYEVLSGTAENFAVHGRRMATEFFRMIHF